MNSTYFKKLVNPSNKEITVIAEMSGNHQNSYNAALKFINSCIKQNVDIVKFQVYKPDTMTIKSESSDFLIKKSSQWKKFKSLYDLFQHAHTPWTWIEKFTKILILGYVFFFCASDTKCPTDRGPDVISTNGSNFGGVAPIPSQSCECSCTGTIFFFPFKIM